MMSMLLSGAMILSMGVSASGEEIGADNGFDVTKESDYTHQYDHESEAGIYSYGFNNTESASTYCGTIFVKDDGLYDALTGGNPINLKGLSYNSTTHTLTLENVNIGEVYDGPLSHKHSGSLVFCDAGETEMRYNDDYHIEEYGRIYPDYTIELKGSNYLGGFSTYERRNTHTQAQLVPASDNGTHIGIDSCISFIDLNDDHFYKNKHGNVDSYKVYKDASVLFKGDGELTIQGRIGPLSVSTGNLPVWYSLDDEGTSAVEAYISGNRTVYLKNERDFVYCNLGSFNERVYADYEDENSHCFPLKTYYYQLSGNDLLYESNTGSYYYSYGYESFAKGGRSASEYYPESYIKIGGNKPDVPEKPVPLRPVLKNIKVGSHTISVCYVDNIPYQGRKLKADDLNLQFYVDGDRDSYHGTNVKVRFKNSKDVAYQKNGKTVSPCFAFTSGNSELKKALNTYFRNKENWIGFNILPVDIKQADTTFLSLATFKEKDEKKLKSLSADGFREMVLGKNLKIKGNEIKSINMMYSHSGYKKGDRCLVKSVLKFDKKYSDSKPNRKKDFHAALQDDYIVLTGQGNFTGTVIVNNPYKGNIHDDNNFYYYQDFEHTPILSYQFHSGATLYIHPRQGYNEERAAFTYHNREYGEMYRLKS